MSYLYVGTAYNQVYQVPLDIKQPITKFGQKKKTPVVSIHLSPHNKQLQFANHLTSYHITLPQNQIRFSEYLPKEENDNNKIIYYSEMSGQRYYCTSHGEIYYRNLGEQEKQSQKLHTLFYNQTYQNAIKSLPPQRVGKLMPEYTKAILSYSDKCNNYVAGFVGKGVLPFVYSFDKFSMVWKAKNVTNDELDLEVPPNDIDLCFLNHNYHLVAAHAQNKLRIYDINGRRRKPISDITLTEVIKADKVNLTKIVKSPCQKYLYVGNHKGSVYELDIRKNYAVAAKFKGIKTTIKDLQIYQDHLAVVSLDGFLRIFNTTTKQKQFQRYLNVHPEVLKIDSQGIRYPQQQAYKVEQINENQQYELLQEGDKPKQPSKVKKIRKRNKVGLKYLEPRPFDENVKVEQKREQENQQQSEMKEQKNYGEDYDEDLEF